MCIITQKQLCLSQRNGMTVARLHTVEENTREGEKFERMRGKGRERGEREGHEENAQNGDSDQNR